MIVSLVDKKNLRVGEINTDDDLGKLITDGQIVQSDGGLFFVIESVITDDSGNKTAVVEPFRFEYDW